MGKDQFPLLEQEIRQPTRAFSNSNTRSTSRANLCPAPPPLTANQWKKPLPWVNQDKVPNNKGTPKSQFNSTGTAAFAFGEDISTILSILQIVRSAEVAKLAAKFRKASHGVDRLRFILENQDLINDVDNAIGALTNNTRTVIENTSRTVPAKSDRRELPRDVSESIRDKNAALRRVDKYPTCENRSRVRALQRKVKTRIKEVRNENWSDLMTEILPNHKAYWGLAKALKIPALKRPDNSIAIDEREKAECLANSIECQCSENPLCHLEHVRKLEEEVSLRVSLPLKDDLDPIAQDGVLSKSTTSLGCIVRARRPSNVLLDPPDDLTVEVEKLIEVNRMAID
ncbi:hypothetical protein EVAR_85539_1 [Eumeta japonica]|uniref:Uncharacterized protein n=1 Tax=Eumeta variegata TaxID=151549 RepID=A0A4C1VCN4_EUMVA|nr:hypothetical protein EVAR_85539_1 [Eumeta japonica]